MVRNTIMGKFVSANIYFGNLTYATLKFDISLLPLLGFHNVSQLTFRGNSKIIRIAIVIHCEKQTWQKNKTPEN